MVLVELFFWESQRGAGWVDRIESLVLTFFDPQSNDIYLIKCKFSTLFCPPLATRKMPAADALKKIRPRQCTHQSFSKLITLALEKNHHRSKASLSVSPTIIRLQNHIVKTLQKSPTASSPIAPNPLPPSSSSSSPHSPPRSRARR